MAGELVFRRFFRRPNPTAPPPHALLPPTPRPKVHRRVPNVGLGGPPHVPYRHRQARTPPIVLLPAAGRKRQRSRLAAPAPPVILRRKSGGLRNRAPALSPAAGKVRRTGRPSILGVTPISVVWQRRQRRRPLLQGIPPTPGRRRRGRVPRTADAAPATFRRRVVRLPKMRPPDTGRARRRRTYFTGIGAPPPMRRRVIRRPAAPWPLGGRSQRRRGWLSGVGIPRVLRRRALRRLPTLPPFVGQKRRSRVPRIAPFVLVRRRTARPVRIPPPGGKVRRGRTYFTGQFVQAVTVRQQRRRWPALIPALLRLRRRVRIFPRQRGATVGTAVIVPGPYYLTGQVYVAGASVGDVQGE